MFFQQLDDWLCADRFAVAGAEKLTTSRKRDFDLPRINFIMTST
jgi:hypothetical protein